jgi:antitoxin YefM
MESRHSLRMQFNITVSHDEEEGVWFVQSSDVPGLNAEASTFEELVEVITDLSAELIASNRTEREGGELIITCQNREAVMRLVEFGGLGETRHLLSSPANGEHLRRSIEELDEGHGIERKLIDE